MKSLCCHICLAVLGCLCRPIYNQTLLNNWTAQSYNATLYQNASALGAGELITQCTKLAPNGTLVFTASGPGYFLGKLSLSFWAQYATSARDLQLSLASSDGTLPQVIIRKGMCILVFVQRLELHRDMKRQRMASFTGQKFLVLKSLM